MLPQVRFELNEWDDYAVDEADQLTEDGLAKEVVTVTISSKRAEGTIHMALAKSADRTIHE